MEDCRPKSCDTFVAFPPATPDNSVIFGKNSDRPEEEVQEVVYIPAADHETGTKVQCTYTEIDQVAHTFAVILSKPSWMWGTEMGSNEKGVCIGNEAVWTVENSEEDLKEKLLGMDLLRLGLERSKNAKEAMEVIADLLQKHGQGGPCSDNTSMQEWSYHNSFLIADGKEAWVLETAGHLWAAEHVTGGVRNISNELSIRKKIDASHPNLKSYAQEKGYWKPKDGDFDFAKVYSASPPSEGLDSGRYGHGRKLLQKFSENGQFGVEEMFRVLRDGEICMTGAFSTTGSQVSKLFAPGSVSPNCHWFTATPNPCQSFFKPFVFCSEASIGNLTTSPDFGADEPRKQKPRFQNTVDRQYPLYKAHKHLVNLIRKRDPTGEMLLMQIAELEKNCVHDIEEALKHFNEKCPGKVAKIFEHMVNLEMNFYKM